MVLLHRVWVAKVVMVDQLGVQVVEMLVLVVVAQVANWPRWLLPQGMWDTQVAFREVGLVTVEHKGQVVIASQHLWNVVQEVGTLPVLGGLAEVQQVEHMDKEVDLLTSEETISCQAAVVEALGDGV